MQEEKFKKIIDEFINDPFIPTKMKFEALHKALQGEFIFITPKFEGENLLDREKQKISEMIERIATEASQIRDVSDATVINEQARMLRDHIDSSLLDMLLGTNENEIRKLGEYTQEKMMIRRAMKRGELLCPICKIDLLTLEDEGHYYPEWFILCPRCKRSFSHSFVPIEKENPSVLDYTVELEEWDPVEVTPKEREYLKARGLLRKEYEK
jgi:uncharacterized protein YbaR (Trm112 family)